MVSGGQLVPTGPRRAADPPEGAEPSGVGIEDLEDWAPHDFARHDGRGRSDVTTSTPRQGEDEPGIGTVATGDEYIAGHRQWGTTALERGRRFVEGHLSAVCLVLALGLLFTAAVVMRARPTTVELSQQPLPVATPSAQPATGQVASPAPASSAIPARIRIHVAGAVVRPGVVTLPAGARVADAVGAAGGLRQDSRLGQLNLAAPLEDGDQVWVGDSRQPGGEVRPAGQTAPADGPGAAAQSGAGTPGRTPTGGADGTRQVDLNQATLEQLDQLPGVGPVTAQRILAWRQEHGRFSRVEELQEVDGIGPKTYSQLSTHVRV